MSFCFESSLEFKKKVIKHRQEKQFKLDEIPENFLNDEKGREYLIDTINDTILCRENQENVNRVYDKLIKGHIGEMDRRIPKRNTKISNTKG